MLPRSTFAPAIALLFVVTMSAPGQGTLFPLISNGPESNRFTVVILSEGYTSTQLPQFGVDATNLFNGIFTRTPFREYSNHFNGYAIAVPSAHSGSDHPSYQQTRDTYFNSTYDIADRLITIPHDSTGQGRVDSLVSNLIPTCDLSILLVNDNDSGASDGAGKTVIVAKGPNSLAMWNLAWHEIGHVMAGLGDEYTNANPGYPAIEEPNTTRETNRNLIKWRAWIDPTTPVPTPANPTYLTNVGLFQGAHYNATGWYRPRQECTMRHETTTAYCEICRETLLLSLYQEVRPVDNHLPSTTNLLVSAPQPARFQLMLRQPVPHGLIVSWHTNGVAVAAATNSFFDFDPVPLSPGVHTVEARISDPTLWVRNDPTGLLKQTVLWTVQVSLAQLELSQPQVLSPGTTIFRVSGTSPQPVTVQGSTDWQTWISLKTNTLSSGSFWFTNTSLIPSHRFYRAVTPPQ